MPKLVSAFAFTFVMMATTAFSQDVASASSVIEPSQLKAAARESFEQGSTDEARKHLSALLAIYRQVSAGDSYGWSRRLAEVAREYLRAGELKDALETLGEAADLSVPIVQWRDNGLASTAGGLNRRLAELDAGRRYELFHEWTMPTDERPAVRVLSSIVPAERPPSVFARALGERPRENSFPIAKTGEVPGLFSTAWELVQAATESARLPKLIAELEPLVDKKTPNVEFLFTVAQIAQAKREVNSTLIDRLKQHAERLRNAIPKSGKGPQIVKTSDIVIAAVCLQHESLQPIGEDILHSLIDYTWGDESWVMRPFLRRALATAIQKQHGASAGLFDSGLKYWIPASVHNSKLSAEGTTGDLWLAHEDHILHMAGPRNDYLLFRYPLIGDFEFSCEAQDGGRGGTEGGVGYGGLGYEAWGYGQLFKVWDADFKNEIQRPCPFVLKEGRVLFNRLGMKTGKHGTTFLSNGHPVWRDSDRGTGSPWIALRSFNDRRPIFRNFMITGKPVIPREVRMSDGEFLRGWLAGYYEERMPSPVVDAALIPAEKGQKDVEAKKSGDEIRANHILAQSKSFDWFLSDGIIHGTQRPNMPLESWLRYFRPVQNGESISYEFQYEPNKYAVHPTIGRIAFLIEPAGVRLHWLTDVGNEWTGMDGDNAIAEPLNRRGPRPLPLKAGKWNRATIRLDKDKLTLSLNDTIIYQRSLELENRRIFGFYHNRAKTAVRVRNVVLRGDWPERLTADQLDNLAAIANPKRSADRRATSAIFQDQFIAENSLAVHRRAAKMAAEDRYKYLSDWVLPGEDHNTFRINGDFTQTHPAPIIPVENAVDARRIAQAKEKGLSRIQIGGNLVSPAFDLIQVAKELDQLEELRNQVAQIKPIDDQGRKSQHALLVLIDIAHNNETSAAREFEELFALSEAVTEDQLPARWPDTLAIWRGLRYMPTRKVASELLQSISARAMRRWRYQATSEAWTNHVCTLEGLAEHLQQKDSTVDQFSSAPALRNWIPASYFTARTRGNGRAPTHWQAGEIRVDKLSGHQQDYLYYRSPLTGNYQVECNVTQPGQRESHLMVAGTFVAPRSNRKMYKVGNVREDREVEFDPPLAIFRNWVRFRTVVQDRVATTYINGRKLHQQQLPENHEPWLAVRGFSRYHGAVQDLQITGEPVVPEQINLTALKDLPGWVSYYGNSVGAASTFWQQLGDLQNGGGIVGRRYDYLAGSGTEALLRYNRPMIEDGTIDYEFFYREGEYDVHPALDRLAFVLDPGGVRIHWITDGKWDRTGLSPTNVFDEPDNRRGPKRLPLKPDAWNSMRLSLAGDTVELLLNDQLVYERKLEVTNQRTFGLFHYSDRTESRVRNVVWRGDWPRTIPSIADQQLADKSILAIDAKLPQLKSVFEHDFARDGLPPMFFHTVGKDVSNSLSMKPNGIQVTQQAAGAWTQAAIQTRFRVYGDFDITAAFDGLKTRVPKNAGIQMFMEIKDDTHHQLRLARREQINGRHTLSGSVTEVKPDGSRRARPTHQYLEPSAGRFRIARRGKTMHFLFAEGNSSVFRLIASEPVTEGAILDNGVRLTVSAAGTGMASVVWKDVSLRAEKLTFCEEQKVKRVLYIMNSDGTGLRQLTKPMAQFDSHGSPDWSPDGKKIAFDGWGGAASQMFIINTDGKGLMSLGDGNMPTFSADGKELVFSWGGRGITKVKSDASDREVVTRSGWGSAWSPDGKSIALGYGGNVAIWDLARKEQKLILEGEHARRYDSIYWNMTWSPDNKQVCFKATNRTTGKYEVAIADVAGSSKGFLTLYESESDMTADFSWHPSGERILFSMNAPELKGMRLFTLNPKMPGPPQLLLGQPEGYKNYDADYSPDGKQIAFASERPLEWKEWIGKAKPEKQEAKK